MGKYLRPRRGNENEAIRANIKLWNGEVFFEYPEGRGIGKSPGRIIIGNGDDTYQEKENVTDDPTKFQPFITDPSIYVPLHNDFIPKEDYKYDDEDRGTTVIGKWLVGFRKLPEILGYIKEILCEHIDNLKYDDYRIKILRSNIDDTDHDISDLYTKIAENASSISYNKTSIDNLTTYVANTYVTKSIFNAATSSINTRLNNIYINNVKFWHAGLDGYFYDYDGNRGPASHDAAGMVSIIYKMNNGSTYEVNSLIVEANNNYYGLCPPYVINSINELIDTTIPGIYTAIQDIYNRLDTKIETLENDVSGGFSSVSNEINNLKNRATDLESRVNNHENRIRALENK